MSEVPERCTTCSTPIPPGRTRCVGCGKVFGEDNRCPHCNAVAAVQSTVGGYTCAACGGSRDVLPGTVILGRPGVAGGAGPGRPAHAVARRAGGAGLRALGVLSIAGGIVAAALAGVLLPGFGGIAVAAALGAAGVGLGAFSLRQGARASRAADQAEQVAVQQAILELAAKSQGDLTATEVARALRMTLEEADQALTAMADGSRVTVEITTEGLVHYVFRELYEPQGPRVRVEAEETAGQEVEVSATEEHRREAER